MSNNPSTALVKQEKASALSSMAARFNVEPAKLLATLKNTVFKGASDDELMALVIVANEFRLNPFKKEIYAFPAKGGGITPIVGVDGWINIMNSQPSFDGVEFEVQRSEDGKLDSCTCTIHRKDRSHPIRVTEYFSECKRNTDPWNQMPNRMLRNRALAQCVRLAFTAGGIIDEDEAPDFLDPVQMAKPAQATVSDSTSRRSKGETLPASKKAQLGAWMTERQFTWEQIQPVCKQEEIVENADKIESFDDLSEDEATAIFGARTGIEYVLKTGNGGAK